MENDRWDAIRQRITGSPIYGYLGLHLESMGDGRARLRLPVRDDFRQVYGAVHGGMIATVADACIGIAIISLIPDNERAVTVDLRVNYIAPLLSGELVGEGRIVHKGRTLVFGEAELRDGDGRLVATASATYMAIRNGGNGSGGQTSE